MKARSIKSLLTVISHTINTCCLWVVGVVLLAGNARAQINVVRNPSFEEIKSCPTYFSQINYAIGWDSLKAGGGATPDLFSSCAKNNTNIGVPINSYGLNFQMPRTGNNYSGVYVFNENSSPLFPQREYEQGSLTKMLTIGKTYCVTFYVNFPFGYCQYGIDKIGAYLDDGSILTQSYAVANVNPQIENPNNLFLTDSINWMRVQGTFIANGTEQYISIGNFKDYSNTRHKLYGGCNTCGGTYLYIDDVSVIEVNTKAQAGRDTIIKKGDSTYVGLHDLGDEYTWYANGDSVYYGSEAGIMVKPIKTTTYIVKQQICSVVTYDTCVVNVTTVGVNELGMQNSECRIWPNPNTTGMLNVTSFEILSSVGFYNVLGEKVLEAPAAKEIDISSLPKGLYVVKLNSYEGTITHRLVLQ